MSRRPKQTPKFLWGEVLATESLTPHMFRIVFGGDDLEGFAPGPETDQYVKLQIPPLDAPYRAPFDLDEVRERYPRELWPRTRSYSVRDWDAAARRLTIDFVYHGDRGVAGPWAASAQPGDQVRIKRPKGKYSPDPDAPWHLMIGDTCVIPAITRSVAAVPAGTRVHVLIEVDGPEDELPLNSAGELHKTWIHRSGGSGADLLSAVSDLAMPSGEPHVFLHGEAEMVRAIRGHLIAERGIDRERISASGYWKRERTDEEWRAEKSEWKKLVKAQ